MSNEPRCPWGEPVGDHPPLYHGTTDEARACIIDKGQGFCRKGVVNGRFMGDGFYFSTNRDTADHFGALAQANQYARGRCVLQVRLDPLAKFVRVPPVELQEEAWRERFPSYWERLLQYHARREVEDYDVPEETAKKAVANRLRDYIRRDQKRLLPALSEFLAAEGCDGIRYDHGGAVDDVYLVMNAKAITRIEESCPLPAKEGAR